MSPGVRAGPSGTRVEATGPRQGHRPTCPPRRARPTSCATTVRCGQRVTTSCRRRGWATCDSTRQGRSGPPPALWVPRAWRAMSRRLSRWRRWAVCVSRPVSGRSPAPRVDQWWPGCLAAPSTERHSGPGRRLDTAKTTRLRGAGWSYSGWASGKPNVEDQAAKDPHIAMRVRASAAQPREGERVV